LPVNDYINRLLESQFFSPEQLEEIQNRKLNKILTFSIADVPFYRDITRENSSEIINLNDFPFLLKSDIRDHLNVLLSTQDKRSLYTKKSGGTTGGSITVYKDRLAFTNALAATWRGYSWAGVGIGYKQARFWGEPQASTARIKMHITDFIAHRKRFSAFSFSKKDLSKYFTDLERYMPDYFYGYTSMLAQLADYYLEVKSEPKYKLTSIITTSEILTDYDRKKLENVFGTKVYNEYGCAELGTIAHECESGNLHINDENLLVEIYNGDKKCAPGEIGEVVITDLNCYAMPLIKYKLGDLASISDKRCKCGRGLKILDNLCGRVGDLIKNKNGKSFHRAFFMDILKNPMAKHLGIISFQVVQIDWDDILLNIVTGQGYSKESESFLKSFFVDNFCENTKLRFNLVNEIKRTRSGKVRLLVGKDDPYLDNYL
jgi:phenylacetate-CoA ligase